MGGYGSGRWGTGKAGAKILAESCRSLDINRLVREGVVRPNVRNRASWEWLGEDRKEVRASIGLEVQTEADSGTVRLLYTVGKDGEEREVQDYPIPLVTTGLASGGRRWWFRCMASRNGGPPCRRSVGVLYLPPGGKVFACRRCYDLAYESSRESHRGSRLWASIGAAAGLSGREARKVLDREFRQERRWKARARQRARIFEEGGA
jgi:hypothetical protein